METERSHTPERPSLVPCLETERLTLRPITMEDAPAIFDYAKNPDVTQFVRWNTHTSIDDTREFIRETTEKIQRGGVLSWGIGKKGSGRLIGTTSLRFSEGKGELGYTLHPHFWGRGVVTEANRAVIEFGFKELGLERIEATCDVQNPASEKVMEKLGMHFQKYVTLEIKGESRQAKLYALNRSN